MLLLAAVTEITLAGTSARTVQHLHRALFTLYSCELCLCTSFVLRIAQLECQLLQIPKNTKPSAREVRHAK